MPQTVEEHIQELEDSDSDSSFDSTDEDEGENHSIAVGLAGLAMNSPRVSYQTYTNLNGSRCRSSWSCTQLMCSGGYTDVWQAPICAIRSVLL